MKCPYCGAGMLVGYRNTTPLTQIFTCTGNGPQLTKESGPCPYEGQALTKPEIDNVVIFLLDNDMDD